MQVSSIWKSTQECYARAVRMLIEFYGKDPRKISENDLK
ncbi:MAG: phage integrase N-terminal SAM-like domain-containing protein, partial [Desulfobacterales bacterium]